MMDRQLSEFLDELGAGTATPGGGAASGVTAAMGVGLMRMVFRFAAKRAKGSAGVELLALIDGRLAEFDQRARPLAERDAAGFQRVAQAYQLPRSTPDEKQFRSKAIQEGLVGAMVAPEDALHLVRDVLNLAREHRGLVHKNLAADFANGAALLQAAARGAWCNVQVNAAYLDDEHRAGNALDRAAVLMQEIRAAHDVVCRAGQDLF